MANFKTHLSVASALSGVLATGLLEVGIATPKDVFLYFSLGTLGGILPDIDANNSIPGRIVFNFFAIVLAFLITFVKAETYSIVELVLLWGLTYAVAKHVVFLMFAKCTVHRGVFHSILAAAFFWFLTTSLAYHLFGLSTLASWVAGLFVCTGYLIHLSLDEIYSVNVVGMRLKKSFGTALKLVSRDLQATAFLLLATVLCFLTTPSAERFTKVFLSVATYQSVKTKLLPKAGWFQL